MSEYFPILSLKEYAQWLITLVVMAFSTQWIIIRIQKWMCVRGVREISRRRRETRPASPPNANASLERRARIRVRNA